MIHHIEVVFTIKETSNNVYKMTLLNTLYYMLLFLDFNALSCFTDTTEFWMCVASELTSISSNMVIKQR